MRGGGEGAEVGCGEEEGGGGGAEVGGGEFELGGCWGWGCGVGVEG